jgi:hypothetical protein
MYPFPLVRLQDQMESRDSEYLSAEAAGDDGQKFLKKLQRMWFVMEHKGSEGVILVQSTSP